LQAVAKNTSSAIVTFFVRAYFCVAGYNGNYIVNLFTFLRQNKAHHAPKAPAGGVNPHRDQSRRQPHLENFFILFFC
jgi:hypothetical protein